MCRDDSFYRAACRFRFSLDPARHQTRLKYESIENSWRDLYMRLDSGQTCWKGHAFDRATNGFEPYEMELIVSDVACTILLEQLLSVEEFVRDSVMTPTDKLLLTRKTDMSGFCRWRTLRDSLTKMSGLILDAPYTIDNPTTSTSTSTSNPAYHTPTRFAHDPFLKTTTPRTLTFEETQLLRGDNIAIPNKYSGILVGPVMIGMYDPGHPEFMGVFACVMEEALPDTPPTHPLSLKNRN
ncbi:hypothetical protein HK102_009598, partial [Quaeritorhiza haematococci]